MKELCWNIHQLFTLRATKTLICVGSKRKKWVAWIDLTSSQRNETHLDQLFLVSKEESYITTDVIYHWSAGFRKGRWDRKSACKLLKPCEQWRCSRLLSWAILPLPSLLNMQLSMHMFCKNSVESRKLMTIEQKRGCFLFFPRGWGRQRNKARDSDS